MNTQAPPQLKATRSAFSSLLSVGEMATLLVLATGAFAQVKNAVPATVTSIAQTIATVSGVPTLLTVNGTGNCKYRVSLLKQSEPAGTQPILTYSSTPQSPFPMSLKILDATPAGTYTWTVVGIDGCMGVQHLTFKVQ